MTAGQRVSGAGQRGGWAAGQLISGTAGQRVSRSADWLRFAVICSASTALLSLCPAVPLSAQTSLTIYNDGRVLVRRTLPLSLPKGASSQRLTIGALDPATVFSLDSSVTLVGLS
nr:hypothetical protein [Gemmatimonadales bacterium]